MGAKLSIGLALGFITKEVRDALFGTHCNVCVLNKITVRTNRCRKGLNTRVDTFDFRIECALLSRRKALVDVELGFLCRDDFMGPTDMSRARGRPRKFLHGRAR